MDPFEFDVPGCPPTDRRQPVVQSSARFWARVVSAGLVLIGGMVAIVVALTRPAPPSPPPVKPPDPPVAFIVVPRSQTTTAAMGQHEPPPAPVVDASPEAPPPQRPLWKLPKREPRPLPPDVVETLEKADRLELISLDPEELSEEERPKVKDLFHGWRVLGRTTVANPAARHELAEAVVLGVGKGTGIGAKCFEPRHGIRATYGEKVVDLVICFACHWVYVFPDGREEQTSSHPTGGRAEPLLNRLLTEANVPLPKPAGPK